MEYDIYKEYLFLHRMQHKNTFLMSSLSRFKRYVHVYKYVKDTVEGANGSRFESTLSFVFKREI